jgi:predicted enzyme related to lactoylglutathione lyase
MAKKDQNNKIDFVEFPAHTIAHLEEAKTFYAAVFGWSYMDWGDDYGDTQDSGLGSGINADPEHRPSHPLVVIYADNISSAREKVIAAKGRITREIFSFPGGSRPA